jgi:hypothetical protein
LRDIEFSMHYLSQATCGNEHMHGLALGQAGVMGGEASRFFQEDTP